jgi:proline utilization trans-activator
VSTLVHFHQCINLLVRPLLFHVVQKRLKSATEEPERDWKEGLSTTTIAVIETCISAAHDTIAMMIVAERKNLLGESVLLRFRRRHRLSLIATYGYMDGEHVFSAAIVLVMVCIALPYTQNDAIAMNTAIELLQRIADRGNNHQLNAKCRKLSQLRSITNEGPVAPLGVVPDLADVAILEPPRHPPDPPVPRMDPEFPFPFLPLDMNHDDLEAWEQGFENVHAGDFNFPNLEDFMNA